MKINIKIGGILILTSLFFSTKLFAWGFFAHKKINELAVYTLPVEMIGFYKKNINYIIEKSVQPDKRRYIDPSEAARHYIDIDHFGDSAIYKMPHNWYQAVELYSEDTLKAYGIVPWHILLLKKLLTDAFIERDFESALRISTDIGHYIADSNVPLHTTENYNGQLTGQHGIHGLWESRLPELYIDNYNLFVGKAIYLNHGSATVWTSITNAHLALDSVLRFEKVISEKIGEESKYSFENRAKSYVKVYSKKFCQAYHNALNNMVERQMRRAIHQIGNIWYSAWVDAGQPDLPYYHSEEISEDSTTTKLIVPNRIHE